MINDAIAEKFYRRIHGDSAVFSEAGSKNTVVTFFNFPVTGDHIFRRIGAVRHDNSNNISFEMA